MNHRMAVAYAVTGSWDTSNIYSRYRAPYVRSWSISKGFGISGIRCYGANWCWSGGMIRSR